MCSGCISQSFWALMKCFSAACRTKLNLRVGGLEGFAISVSSVTHHPPEDNLRVKRRNVPCLVDVLDVGLVVQAAEAEQEALDMLGVYTEFASQMAAIPVVAGRKSAAESFAGAVCTYTIEAMMSDRRALQVSSVLLRYS